MDLGGIMRELATLTAGVAVLGLLAGCGSSEKKADTPAPQSSQPTTQPAPTKPAGPLTAAQYQASLTELDKRLAAGIKALSTANNADNLVDAMTSLAQTLDNESSALASVKPPAAALAAHRVLQARLKAAGSALAGAEAGDAHRNAKCGGVVYTSQQMQRKLTADLAGAVAALRKVGLRAGTTLPNLGPEPADQRPSNGDILVRSGSRGSGRLQVTNGTSKDVAVSVVTDGQPASKPQVMMYVLAKRTATISRIGGSYHIYFKSGSDWNSKRRQFSSECSFQKFDQGFGPNQGWRIDLQPSALGNASSSEVDAY